MLSAGRTPSPVQQDVEQPGLERGPAFEAIHAADDGQPGVLHDFLGHRAAADDALRQALQARLVGANQLDERRLVARLQALDEIAVVAHGQAG
jgi:hypothetical protein